MDDLAIVIFSCDKNEELWPIFYKCLNKYWANHPKAYLLTETIPCSLFETINYDFDVEHWSNRMRCSFNDIKENNIIFICDDCFLDNYVNLEKLNKCIELLDEGYANVQFELSYDGNDADSVYPGFKEKTEYSQYKFSFLCGIWKKDKLLDLLQSDASPWTIEYEQKYDKEKHKFLQVTGDKVISWFNDGYGGNGAIKFGQWRPHVVDFFKKENIEVDYSKKGFYDGDQ